MPLTYLLSALVQWLWAGPFSEAVLCCVMLAITAAVVFVVSTELTGSRIAGVLAAAVVVGFYPRLYSYPKVLVPAVALYLLHRYAVLPRMSRLWLLAIWIAAATLLRHDLGVYAAAGTGAGLLSVHWGSVRASMYSAAGREVRTGANPARQQAFTTCVAEALPELDDASRRRRAAVVQMIGSSHGWACLKDYWGLDTKEAARAAAEAIAILLGRQDTNDSTHQTNITGAKT